MTLGVVATPAQKVKILELVFLVWHHLQKQRQTFFASIYLA